MSSECFTIHKKTFTGKIKLPNIIFFENLNESHAST
jgi:hypothetical protein